MPPDATRCRPAGQRSCWPLRTLCARPPCAVIPNSRQSATTSGRTVTLSGRPSRLRSRCRGPGRWTLRIGVVERLVEAGQVPELTATPSPLPQDRSDHDGDAEGDDQHAVGGDEGDEPVDRLLQHVADQPDDHEADQRADDGQGHEQQERHAGGARQQAHRVGRRHQHDDPTPAPEDPAAPAGPPGRGRPSDAPPTGSPAPRTRRRSATRAASSTRAAGCRPRSS